MFKEGLKIRQYVAKAYPGLPTYVDWPEILDLFPFSLAQRQPTRFIGKHQF